MHDAPRRLRIRPYAQPDAAPTLAVFIAAVTRTAAADYDPAQIRAWVGPAPRDPAGWHLGMSSRGSFVATVDDEIVGFSDVAAGGTFVMTLPGSPGGVNDGLAILDPLLEHLLGQREGAPRGEHGAPSDG
ncbi:hypothetical protein ACFPZL_04655 [Leucobacter soli]|uniref:hypothetical protein n=1 Tax=Leucobacter soli TaxID=2812850 RepID=UPI00360681C6